MNRVSEHSQQMAHLQARGQCEPNPDGKLTPVTRNIREAYSNPNKTKVMNQNYLRMISDATGHLSGNKGALRKFVWEFL